MRIEDQMVALRLIDARGGAQRESPVRHVGCRRGMIRPFAAAGGYEPSRPGDGRPWSGRNVTAMASAGDEAISN